MLDIRFWQNEADLLWLALSGVVIESLLDGMYGGVEALPTDLQPLVDFDTLNTDALQFAKEYRYDKIKGITDTTMKQVQEAMTDWINSGDPLSSLEDILTPIFGEVRAQMIAATEITRIFAEGNASAWESTGFVSQQKWMTNRDDRVCPICGPRDGQLYNLKDPEFTPPAHVRCRCWMNPVVDVEAVLAETERILNG